MIKYVTKAMQNCTPGNPDCLINELNQVSDYDSILESKGFENRILKLKNDICEYRNGWKKIS